MNEYYMIVDFAKDKIQTNLNELVRTDYNSTKINFTFDKIGRVLFKLLYPDGTYYVKAVENNELILEPGVLNQDGECKIELSLYGEDNKLTDYAIKKIFIRKELINVDEEVEVDDRLPILDQLINDTQSVIVETSNLNITGQKTNNVTYITLTDKQGNSGTLEILDGEKGDAFTYDDFTPEQLEALTGPNGEPGRDGVIQYTAGNNISIENNVISANLSGYATESYVNTAITNAITDALGGNY